MRQLDFRDHRRELDDNRYVYAVVSRRVGGLSIGINLNPDKVCNFDCPYCQVDRTTPGGERAVDVERLAAELDGLLSWVDDRTLWDRSPFDTAPAHLRQVGDLSLAGDGEPTSAPEFVDAVRQVGAVRDDHGLHEVPIRLLTNATLLHRPRVKQGLELIDDLGGEIWAKLDAGTEPWFQLVDGTQFPFQRVLDNLESAAKARPIVIQSMFHTWEGEGPSDDEIAAWADRLRHVLDMGGRIREVQVYSVARRPSDARVGVLDTPRLDVIAEAARSLGVDAVVYPGIDWA